MPAADPTVPPVRGQKIICIPCSQQQYEQIVGDPERFRKYLDQQIEAHPELFPAEIRRGYRMKDLYSRMSNPVDRLLRRLDYHLYCTQHLHGKSAASAERRLRGWALIHNFAPMCPWTIRGTPGLRNLAERLNGKRYHSEWLQNLLVSASLGDYHRAPRNPR